MSINIKETLWAKPTKPVHHSPIILSNTDIIIPRIYILGHYFFKNVENKNGFMDVHKIFSSLEDILSDYYPLAGQLKDEPDGRVSIVQSDKGVPFIVAESPDITIRQLEERNWENFSIPDGLLPAQQKAEPGAPLFAAQHTTLADGSVVLGVAVHHSVADGNGIFSFLENWGRKARKESFTPPVHDRTLLKASGNPPSREHPEYMVLNLPLNSIINKAPLPQAARKIFYFSKDDLKKLKITYSSKNQDDARISTNDALVAHICRTVARARGIPLDEQISCAFACDGRRKFNPPLPPSYFGNIVL
jgi:shikimate O-hydroxycinnamoyltransferase